MYYVLLLYNNKKCLEKPPVMFVDGWNDAQNILRQDSSKDASEWQSGVYFHRVRTQNTETSEWVSEFLNSSPLTPFYDSFCQVQKINVHVIKTAHRRSYRKWYKLKEDKVKLFIGVLRNLKKSVLFIECPFSLNGIRWEFNNFTE